MRPLDALAGGHGHAAVLAEVDGDAVGAEHLTETLERGVERVRQRQPGDGLADDGEQRAASLELEARVTRTFGRAERVSCADGEAREPNEAAFVRAATGSEPELQHPERWLAELKRDELSVPAVALHRHRAVLVEDPLRHALHVPIGLQRPVCAVDFQGAAPEPPEKRALGP